MNKFSNSQGQQASVNFSLCSDVSVRDYGQQACVIEFQAIETCGVPGLVYVSYTPKGKRKAQSIAVHQDCIELM